MTAPFTTFFPMTALVSMACLVSFAFTLGLTYPLFSFLLVAGGHDPIIVGLNAAMTPLGLMLSSLAIPWAVRRWGAWRVSLGCSLGTPLLIVSMGLNGSIEWWMVARFLLGVSLNGVTTVVETVMNQLLTKETRGRVLGIYTTAFSLSFASGPLALAVTGIEGWLPFAMGIATTGIVVPAITACRSTMPIIDAGTSVPISKIGRTAPVILLAVGTFALFDQAVVSLLPVYGKHFEWNESDVVTVVSAMLLGNAAFQFPIGWVSDRTSRRTMLTGCAALSGLICLSLPLADGSWLAALVVFFFLGGIALGIFTVAISELGDRFSGMELLAGNAAFAFMWGLGGFCGPSLAGLSIEMAGPQGLPVLVGMVFLSLAIISRLAR